MTCPKCGEREMVLTDAKLVRFYCDACKHAWRDTTAPSYDDRRLTWEVKPGLWRSTTSRSIFTNYERDVSGNQITGP